MKLLSPTQHRRLNEIVGFLLLSLGLVMLLSLVSYHTQDPSFDTAAAARPLNLVGYPGSCLSDLFFQMFGATALLFPLLTFLLSWKWIRSEELQAGGVKIFGSILLTLALSAGLSFAPLRLFGGIIRIGGTLGLALANYLVDSLNLIGALVVTLTAIVHLASTWFPPSPSPNWRMARRTHRVVRSPRRRLARLARTRQQRAVEKAKQRAAAASAPSTPKHRNARLEREGRKRPQDRTPARRATALRRRWHAALGDPGQPAAEPNTPPWRNPRRAPALRHHRRHPHLPVEELAPVPDLFPALLPATRRHPHLTHRIDRWSSACRPPTC